MKHAVLLSLFVVISLSCGAPPATTDGGSPDGGGGTEQDAGFQPSDSGMDVDAGSMDDAGVVDAGQEDAGLDLDAGSDDAGLGDAGQDDAGFDAGLADAGFDAGTPDAGPADAGAFDGSVPAGCPMPSGVGSAVRVRAMAANLTSGNNQSYDPGHGRRIIQGADPDVVMIQEFNYGTNSVADISGFVDSFDAGYAYYRGNGQIPNGVLSRFPILDGGEWVDPSVSNRGWTWAQIDLPGPHDLWVVSVHLLTSSAGVRNTEAGNLITKFNQNIPAGSYLLLGGDFNTDTRSEACFTTFSSRLVTSGPHPVDQNGDEGTNTSRTKPYDGVYASPCLKHWQGATVTGTSTYPTGLVIDTRVYTPLTDIAPAQFGDSSSSNMQHMGVVKDFFVQP